jgi:hypothetical protein
MHSAMELWNFGTLELLYFPQITQIFADYSPPLPFSHSRPHPSLRCFSFPAPVFRLPFSVFDLRSSVFGLPPSPRLRRTGRSSLH